MIVAGIGARKDVSADDVSAAIATALSLYGIDASAIAALAVIEQKAAEQAIDEAASRLGVPLIVVDDAAAHGTLSGLATHSAASTAATGLGSASEAAALAASGGRLLGPRIATARVTCALAEIEDAQ